MKLKSALAALALAAALPATAAPSLEELSAYSGVSVERLQQAKSLAQKQPKIIATMTRPYESKPWYQYRKFFVTKSRIDAGVDFYHQHEQTLERARKQYGVPPEIVCAIIGVETSYGKNMGSWSVLDALYTLGFHYPPREAYFSKEFANFVKLALREGWDLRAVKGSYAGAMGLGQFMPGSYLDYAVDFNGDGKVNLFTDRTDAIGSVANYFKRHGWKEGRGIFYKAHVPGSKAAALMKREWKAKTSELYKAGVTTKVNLTDQKARLFAFDLEDGTREYAVGLGNFEAIMRYNKSPLYARVVYEMAEFIREGHQRRYHPDAAPAGRLP
ncbi:MAG: lytic murein transglycosylase B [Succinivibrionaceae bacterium]|nr:lytic murein transglycosylase B [Succinivibrionaceae bacterium]